MKRVLLIAFLFVLVFASCNKPTVSNPQENVLYQVEDVFSQKPDSVLQILDTLNLEQLSEKERAHYCLLKVCVYDALFKYDNETDSLLQVAENYFVGGKDKYFEARTCEALSRIAFKMGKGEQYKLNWRQKAVESINQCKHLDERWLCYADKPITEQEKIDKTKYWLHMQLGMSYLDNGYLEDGFRHLKQADDYFAEKQDYKLRASTAYMLGNAYLTKEEFDSCLMYFRYGREAAEQSENKFMSVYYHYSMSIYYQYLFENQSFDNESEKQKILRQSISECQRGLALLDNPLALYSDGFYRGLSEAYYYLQQYDSSAYFAEKQAAFYEANHIEMVPNIWNSNIFMILYKSYEALGDKNKALSYANQYFDMKEQIDGQPKEVEKVKSEYENKLEMLRLQNKQQEKRYRLYLLLTLALVALVVVLWFGNHYRKNKEIEVLRQEEAYRKLQAEFDAASQQVQHARQVLQQRVMEIFLSKEAYKKERIFAEFSAAYPKVMEKLQAAHPNLTESERNIVILSFLGFRTKEEAEILNLSLNTVEKYRTNIRKKVNNDPVSDLFG